MDVASAVAFMHCIVHVWYVNKASFIVDTNTTTITTVAAPATCYSIYIMN